MLQPRVPQLSMEASVRAFHGVVVTADAVVVAELRMRLEDGLAMLSGSRGPELEDVVRDLAAALLGRSVSLGPVLPECGVPNGVWVHGLPQGCRDGSG